MKMKKTITGADISKLPAWAANHIYGLNKKIERLEKENAILAGAEKSPVSWSVGIIDGVEHPIPERARMTVLCCENDPGGEMYIRFYNSNGRRQVKITSSTWGMKIIPCMGNSVNIMLEEER